MPEPKSSLIRTFLQVNNEGSIMKRRGCFIIETNCLASEISTTEELLVEMTILAEMEKLIFLSREKTITAFISNWKSLMDFLLKK